MSEAKNNAIVAAKESGILHQGWVERKDDFSVMEGRDFRSLVANLGKPDTPENAHDRRLAFENFQVIKPTLKVICRASADDKALLAVCLK